MVSSVLFDERMPFVLRLGLAIQTIYDYYLYNADRFAFILQTQHGFPEEKLLSRETDPIGMTARFIGQAVGDGRERVLLERQEVDEGLTLVACGCGQSGHG